MDATPTWDWSSIGEDPPPASSTTEPDLGSAHTSMPEPPENPGEETRPSATPKPKAKATGRRYRPRTCRICLETVNPVFPEESATAATLGISSSSRPTYTSEDPELGRLLSPCKCKGSQKYVHEGCLNAWRLANPTAERNYWQCPTCKFTYQLARLRWAAVLSSKIAQAILTVVILLFSIFILGFVADPILGLWLDPVGTISDTVTSVVVDIEARNPPPVYEQPSTWRDHFAKGVFSLGLVGFIKSFTINPYTMWNLRSMMGGGGRRANTGRGRVENINMFYVAIGVITFLGGIWKMVQVVSARFLRKISDGVRDIGADDDDDDDEDEAEAEHDSESRKYQ